MMVSISFLVLYFPRRIHQYANILIEAGKDESRKKSENENEISDRRRSSDDGESFSLFYFILFTKENTLIC